MPLPRRRHWSLQYLDDTVSIVLEGIEGQKRIARIMEEYHTLYPNRIGVMKLERYLDYQTSVEMDVATGERRVIEVEKQNAVKFIMDDTSWYALRPSGTEPKIKIYMNTVGNTREEAQKKLEAMRELVVRELEKIE